MCKIINMELEIFDTDLGQSVKSTHLFDYLELSKGQYSRWAKIHIVDNIYFEIGKDYSTSVSSNRVDGQRGRFRAEFIIHIDSAKKLCMVSNSPVGEKVRNELVKLTKQVENNQLLDHKKTALLYQLLNIFKFGDKQLEAEEMHKDRFKLSTKVRGNIHKLFSEYRNSLLSINNEALKEAVLIGFQNGTIHKPTAKNIRGRIALIDRYKLIRNAVADYLISTGADTHNAITFADTVMEVAKIAGVEIRIKDEDTLFDLKENAESPKLLGLKQSNKLLK